MVKRIVLLDKFYNIASAKQKEDLIERYRKYLFEKTKGFPHTKIEIKKLREFDKRIEILLKGPEEVFLSNIIKKEIGIICEFMEVKVNQILKGTMIEVGKVGFGIFVDCGILNPPTDVLINLHTLRNQLCGGKETSLKEIVHTFEFIDHFPVYVKILEISAEKGEIRGELDHKSLNMFKKVVDENLEGIFVGGATKSQVKKAIIYKGHLRDIITIKRYGFLENIVLFKEDTDAPGIISHIGKYLRGCKISAIRSQRISPLFK